jgi:predicted transglutaminase-like cysteine proteinase
MNELPLIRAVFREVHHHFVYAFDDDVWQKPERWDSFADEVERGEVFRGDCEDFAMTAVELLLRKGIQPEACRLAVCWTETNEYHAVAIVHGWLIDNRMRTLRPWATVPYKWHKSMRLDQPGEWRDAS